LILARAAALDSEVRQAQLAVFASGVELTGVMSAEVNCNAYVAANRFSFSIAYSLAGSAWWSELPLLIEIQIGLDGAWQSLITGYADSLDVDPLRQTATLHGRDLTSLFISAQTSETFENQTASQIVSSLAVRHGLTPVVAPTTDIVGRYFQTGRTRTALAQHSTATSEWDVIAWLADREGFDAWVDGWNLYFQPAAFGVPTTWITPDGCTGMRLNRSMDLAGGATVVVRSWDSRQGIGITGQASNLSAASGGSTYTTLRPNLSSSDAALMAQHILAQLSVHAAEIECEMPGELTLAVRNVAAFSQTNTDFDGSYQIVEIDRRITFDSGFTQTVTARSLPWTGS
jgi:phage protein D